MMINTLLLWVSIVLVKIYFTCRELIVCTILIEKATPIQSIYSKVATLLLLLLQSLKGILKVKLDEEIVFGNSSIWICTVNLHTEASIWGDLWSCSISFLITTRTSPSK
jgi:hypothetical protein